MHNYTILYTSYPSSILLNPLNIKLCDKFIFGHDFCVFFEGPLKSVIYWVFFFLGDGLMGIKLFLSFKYLIFGNGLIQEV